MFPVQALSAVFQSSRNYILPMTVFSSPPNFESPILVRRILGYPARQLLQNMNNLPTRQFHGCLAALLHA